MDNYPSADHNLLLLKLGIPSSARILDVGGGGNPFKYADVVVDRDFSAGNKHRDGCDASYYGSKYTCINADIQNLPFKDNAFDLVICMHVLEHVEFPDRACDELMRVGKQGFLETPRKWTEYYAGHPTHLWLVDKYKDKIIFEPVTYNESPFINFALPPLWDSKELQNRLFSDFSGIPNVQLAWSDKFKYQITGYLSEKVKHDEFLAESHYCFARNLLLWMGGFDNGAFHANLAWQTVPHSERYQKLAAFYSVLTGDLKKSLSLKLELKYIGLALMCKLSRFVYLKILRFYRKILSLFVKRVLESKK